MCFLFTDSLYMQNLEGKTLIRRNVVVSREERSLFTEIVGTIF